MKFFLLFLTCLINSALASPDMYVDGVHLQNLDSKTYRFVYKEYSLTTAICEIKKPTKEIKNGLVGASMRKVEGLQTISIKEDANQFYKTIEAEIKPNTTVDCLCTRSCEITWIDGKTLNVNEGQTALIKNGVLTTIKK